MNSGEIAEVNLRKLIFFLFGILEVCILAFHKSKIRYERFIKILEKQGNASNCQFATLFVLMDIFIEMNKKTEEQTTYSITLENLLHAQTETDGEAGGSGTDGETDGGTNTGGGCTCPNNPGTYYEGYKNKTKIIYEFSGNIGSYIGGGIIPLNLNIASGASGSLTYCKSVIWWWKKCYKALNGWIPFKNNTSNL